MSAIYLLKHSASRRHCPPGRGRSEAFRGLAKCQAVPSEGSTVLCTTEDPTGSAAEGVLSEKVVPPLPLREKRPSALLNADKPDGAKAHSSGEIKHPSSQPMLARIGVATDAIIPRRQLNSK